MAKMTLKGSESPLLSTRRLEGKIAIVRGGARGIGEAAIRLFTTQGAKVVIGDVEDVLGNELANSSGPFVTYVHCDVTLESHIKNLINSKISHYRRLNNVGVLGDQCKNKSIVNFDIDKFDRIMRVNVRGAALGMKHAARVMIPFGTGSIISMASIAGVMGITGPHAYTASKHAIVGLTKNVPCELGKYRIRVNCISQFRVATSMLINAWRKPVGENVEENGDLATKNEREVKKMEEFVGSLSNLKGVTLRAKDIAEATLFLASDESKYSGGHNLVVDGGVTAGSNCIDL